MALSVEIGCPEHPAYRGLRDSKCKRCHRLFELRREMEELPPLRPYYKLVVSGREETVSPRDFCCGVVIDPRLVGSVK